MLGSPERFYSFKSIVLFQFTTETMNKINGEKFYRVKGFEDYLISKSGKIYSSMTKKFLKYEITKQGYCKVKLNDRRIGRFIGYTVHRLVALQFIPNPKNLPQINHKDGNKLNNSVYNLEWCTSEYNIRHAKENRLYKIEEDNPTAKLTREEVIKIHWFYYMRNFNFTELSKMFNVSDATIGNIIKGFRWSELYKELHGEYSSLKKERRKFIKLEILDSILREYYLENKSGLELEKKYRVSNGYISKIVRGEHCPEELKNTFKEIYKILDNQQPSLCSNRKVQRLKSACLLLNIDNDIV